MSSVVFLDKMPIQSIFFGAFFVSIILQTLKADIPGCHFLETVNITSTQSLQNGSYRYQELEVPANLTGQYDYITTELGINQTVRSHLRGCVCQLKTCIWICCRFKDWDASNEKCTDGLMEELKVINPFLNVTLSNGSVVKKNLQTDFIVLRDRMRWEDYWGKDEYTLFENGSVLFNSFNLNNFRGYDCLHPNQFTSGNTESFVVAFHWNFYDEKQFLPFDELPGKKELLWLSNVFLVLTIAVYFYVRKLRNLHGKCFICYMITSLMSCLYLLSVNVEIPLELCAVYGYAFMYILMLRYTWLSALIHQLWRGFTSVNRAESENSFGAYSIFAWGTPAILTGVLFMFDQVWDSDPNEVKLVSRIGWQNCHPPGDCFPFAFIGLLIIILVSINTTLFILTIISIIRVKLSLRHFSDQNERARNLHSRMQNYIVVLRLMFLMNVQGTVHLIVAIANWNPIMCKYCDSCIGIIIFVLFVLKRSTLRLLMESIRKLRRSSAIK